MANSCEKIIPMLSAYMDGELSEAEAKPVEEHTENCEYCRLMLESYRAINSDTLTVQAPEGFTKKVMEKVKAEGKHKKKKIIPFRHATLAAAMVALVLLGASGVFDTLLGRVNNSDAAQTVVGNAAAEMDAELKENAEHIMSYSAAFGTAPTGEAALESVEETAVEAPAEEAEPVMEEAPAEPAAAAPETRATSAGADTADMIAAEEGAFMEAEAAADIGAPLAPEYEGSSEEDSAELSPEAVLAGTVTYVEPAEDGYYIRIEHNDEETEVFLPASVVGENEIVIESEVELVVSFSETEEKLVASEIKSE